jgi:hypothetical protein
MIRPRLPFISPSNAITRSDYFFTLANWPE